MRIHLVEAFYSGSHQQWAEGYRDHSQHAVEIISLPGRHWKWRMHGGAISLAEKCATLPIPDLYLVTDMMDLSLFKANLPASHRQVPIALYFHENQLSYPWSASDQDVSLKRDRHYSFINYSSCMAADKVYWSSTYQMRSFLDALGPFLDAFPDHNLKHSIPMIRDKSSVLNLGINFPECQPQQSSDKKVILWNHRWEYDKNPDEFFDVLMNLSKEGYPFDLIVCGERYSHSPPIFEEARKQLEKHIIHWGYANSREEYVRLLSMAEILPVTSHQDFFGISIAEAIWCGAHAILPNRLSYPELFGNCAELYDSAEDLYARIIRAIESESSPSNYSTQRTEMERFNWKNQARSYDQEFLGFL